MLRIMADIFFYVFRKLLSKIFNELPRNPILWGNPILWAKIIEKFGIFFLRNQRFDSSGIVTVF